MKANIIVCDPPWSFGDKLTMSKVKRGAESNYKTMSVDDICALDVKSISADDCIMYLWVPSSLLSDGLKVMSSWGFEQKQTLIWVKTKQEPFGDIISYVKKYIKNIDLIPDLIDILKKTDLNSVLSFNLGRIYRQTHEVCLIGTKGSIYKNLKDHSQRSVIFDVSTKHSAKTEKIQDAIDRVMFPDIVSKIEMFARRNREGWVCCGLECPGDFLGEEISVSINKIKDM